AHDAADAKNSIATEDFETGDREFVNEIDGGEVIVLATPDVRAEDFIVPGSDETVADYNAEYSDCSPDDSVVQGVFVDSIEAAFGSKWTDEAILKLFNDGKLDEHVTHYAYPDSRLTTEKPTRS